MEDGEQRICGIDGGEKKEGRQVEKKNKMAGWVVGLQNAAQEKKFREQPLAWEPGSRKKIAGGRSRKRTPLIETKVVLQ